ncbi:MAG: outer membrane beta-barrel protein [Betaproteobacteria bacterium]|nr:outer membrane beta-barrel protein [Betaproteobacteria bacterium]
MPWPKRTWAAILLVLCGSAQAQQPDYYENYFGAGAGFTKLRHACANATPASGFSGVCDESNGSFQVFGGYRFSRYGGVELSYHDFGKARSIGTQNGTAIDGFWRGFGVGLGAVGILPIGERVEAAAKVGVMYWSAEADRFLSTRAKLTDSGFNLTAGVFATWYFMPQAGLRLEYDRFQNVGDEKTLGQFDLDTVSLNLVARF